MTARLTPLTTPWLAALDASSNRLRELVTDLSAADLERPSFAAGWSIAHVLSHLGSAAEISAGIVRRGLAGDDTPPNIDDIRPVWTRWDALDPLAQREGWFASDEAHRSLLVAITDDEAAHLRVPYFAGPLTLLEYAGYRLSEHSLHGWDVAVALEPTASIPASELALLWSRLNLVAGRFHDKDVARRLAPSSVRIELTDEEPHVLSLGAEPDDRVQLRRIDGTAPQIGANATLTGPADAVLRLFYGRLRPVDEVDVTGSITRTDLVELLPGF